MRYLLTSLLCVFTLSLTAQLICDDLIISEYFEGTGNNKGVEFYNPTSESIDLSAYELQRWNNGESGATDATQLFGTLPPLTTWVLVNGQTEDVDLGGGAISPMCDPALQALADQLDNPYPAPTYMNGNDALVLVKNGTTVVDIFGKPGENPGTAWTDDAENGFTDVGDGAAWLTSNHTLRRKYDVVNGLSIPPVVFDTFLEWDTLPVNTWDGLGSHSCICGDSMPLDIDGCTTPFACNYNPEATIDDGSCIFICEGCTDLAACNYDPSANVDDSSCEYLSCAGCTDATACNFNLESTIEDGSCIYPEQYLDCDYNCLNDSDSDGICDEYEIQGCTDSVACNYDSQATDDDGSCEYETCAGCQYEFACNYDPSSTIADNESCEFGTCPGCTDSTACNYNPTVSEDDGSCEYCSCNDCELVASVVATGLAGQASSVPSEATGGGTLTTVTIDLNWANPLGNPSWPADMLVQIGSPDGSCIEFGGFNYASGVCANQGDYTVVYPATWTVATSGFYNAVVDLSGAGVSGDGDWSVTIVNGWSTSIGADYDATFTLAGICAGEFVEVLGCVDMGACNYDCAANTDDGSCDFTSCSGCMDATACNYDADATMDDGTCEYTSCDCPEDVNGDGVIGVQDLLLVLSEFGCSSSCENDINQDGYVAVQDILQLLSEFGNTCE